MAKIEWDKYPDGRCKYCEHAKEIGWGNCSFLGCYCEPYRGKWVKEIKDCPKESEGE